MLKQKRVAVRCLAFAITVGSMGASVPAFAVDAFAPDVVGVRPGMSVDEALAILKQHNPKLGVYPRPAMSGLVAGVGFSDGVNTRTDNQSEDIELSAAMAPSPKIVWGVIRNITYTPEARPTVANIIAALRQKYGKEDGSMQSPASAQVVGVELLDAYWVFDGAGKRVPPQAAHSYAESCRSVHAPAQDALALTQQTRSTYMMPGSVRCDRWIFIHASWQPTYPGTGMTPGVAMNMRTVLANGALHGKAFTASVALVEGVARDQQTKEKQAAEQVKPVL
jgi:hypothetical protein